MRRVDVVERAQSNSGNDERIAGIVAGVDGVAQHTMMYMYLMLARGSATNMHISMTIDILQRQPGRCRWHHNVWTPTMTMGSSHWEECARDHTPHTHARTSATVSCTWATSDDENKTRRLIEHYGAVVALHESRDLATTTTPREVVCWSMRAGGRQLRRQRVSRLARYDRIYALLFQCLYARLKVLILRVQLFHFILCVT